jgi:hypothetical protein
MRRLCRILRNEGRRRTIAHQPPGADVGPIGQTELPVPQPPPIVIAYRKERDSATVAAFCGGRENSKTEIMFDSAICTGVFNPSPIAACDGAQGNTVGRLHLRTLRFSSK